MESIMRKLVTDEVLSERSYICSSCQNFNQEENRCAERSGFLSNAIAIPSSSCPLQKWMPVSEPSQMRVERVNRRAPYAGVHRIKQTQEAYQELMRSVAQDKPFRGISVVPDNDEWIVFFF